MSPAPRLDVVRAVAAKRHRRELYRHGYSIGPLAPQVSATDESKREGRALSPQGSPFANSSAWSPPASTPRGLGSLPW
jgi:hypothetical protein